MASPASALTPVLKVKLKQEKRSSLRNLVRRRQAQLELFKRAHEGTSHWLNVVLLPTETIRTDDKDVDQLSEQWLVLGLTLSKLLEFEKGLNTLRAIAQAIDEWEYHYASRSVQSMRLLRARALENRNVPTNKQDPFKPSLCKFDRKIFYQLLDLSHIPVILDYCQVVLSLCEILSLLYEKFLDGSCTLTQSVDTIFRLDDRLREHVLKPICKGLKLASYHRIEQEINNLKWRYQLGKKTARSIADQEASEKTMALKRAEPPQFPQENH